MTAVALSKDALTPGDYEVIRANPLYKNQFKPDTSKVAREFVARMIGTLMEEFTDVFTKNVFDDEDENTGSSLDFLKEDIALMMGRVMVDSGQFNGMIRPLEENIKRGEALRQATAPRTLPPSLRMRA